MKKEVQKYKQPNSVTRGYYILSSLGQKILSYSLYKACKNYFSERVSFTITEFISNMNYTNSGTIYNDIKQAVNEIYTLDITLKDDENNFSKTRVISGFSILDKNIIIVNFSKKILTLFKKYKDDNYTLLSLIQSKNLRSPYAIRYYQIAMSWKGKADNNKFWYFDYTLDEIRQLFKVKDSVKNNTMLLRIVRSPIEEINKKIETLEIKAEIIEKLGRTAHKIRFWCKAKNLEEIVEPKAIQEKTKKNLNSEIIELLKKAYKTQYEILLEKNNNNKALAEQDLLEMYQKNELK